MRRQFLLLSVLTFQLKASHIAYSSDSSLDDSPPEINRHLASIQLDDDNYSGDDNDKLTIVGDNIGISRAFMDRTPDSQVSSLTSSSSDISKFTRHGDDHYRPRGSSFNSHTNSAPKHVSFGWIQFSDDRWMPSEVMEDTEENRKHILTMMVADARHDNLEYFKYLAGIMEAFEARNPSNAIEQENELDFYNPNSLIFAAVHSDNVELFCEVMKMKGITFEDLNPFYNRKENKKTGRTSPLLKKAFYNLNDSDGDDFETDDDEDDLINAEETVFGQAVIHNSITIVNLLLDKGVRDEFPEKSCTVLHLAIQHGHELLVRILLDRGGSQIDRIDGALKSPLMLAIQFRHPKIVRLLLNLGASMFVTDFQQQNCLHYAVAVEKKNLKILKVLHEFFIRLTLNDRIILVNEEDVNHKIPSEHANEQVVFEYFMKNFNY